MSDVSMPTMAVDAAPRDAVEKPLPAASPDLVRIRPSKGWRPLNLRELWRFRELLWFLALRDIKLRYKQTALGIGWAVLQPLFMMTIASLIFGGLGQISSGDVPYPLF